MKEITNIKGIRQAVLESGYSVQKGLLSRTEAIHYREECEQFMQRAAVIHCRINTDRMPDYVHPRSHDLEKRTRRLYQFFHNKRSTETDHWLKLAIELRNRIEEPWLTDPEYALEKEHLQNYIIVTQYAAGLGKLPKHKDYAGNLNFPLLQFAVILSEPGVDFAGGELCLHPAGSETIKIHRDLNLSIGDALLFDKSLVHSVETTEQAESGVGRWSVLIGARAKRSTWAAATFRRHTFGSPYFMRLVKNAKKILRR